MIIELSFFNESTWNVELVHQGNFLPKELLKVSIMVQLIPAC